MYDVAPSHFLPIYCDWLIYYIALPDALFYDNSEGIYHNLFHELLPLAFFKALQYYNYYSKNLAISSAMVTHFVCDYN